MDKPFPCLHPEKMAVVERNLYLAYLPSSDVVSFLLGSSFDAGEPAREAAVQKWASLKGLDFLVGGLPRRSSFFDGSQRLRSRRVQYM